MLYPYINEGGKCMRLRNKIMAVLAATLLLVSMMAGTAMAREKWELPFEYPNEAAAATDNDVWVKLTGGGFAISTEEVAQQVRSVDITITGKASFDAELIYNSDIQGWKPSKLAGQSVDGELVLTADMDGSFTSYCEIVVNLQNKTEGPLAVTKLDFKDEGGNVLVTWPEAATEEAAEAAPAEEAPAATTEAAAADVPKTGVVSSALIFGLGALACGIGSGINRKKSRA
jgi:hypothetical protein